MCAIFSVNGNGNQHVAFEKEINQFFCDKIVIVLKIFIEYTEGQEKTKLGYVSIFISK